MSISTALSPNTEPDDWLVAAGTCLSFWRWRDENVIAWVEKKLSEFLAGREVVLTSSGRAALYRVLEALDIGAGDEIIIQAFTCLAVPAPIKWRGAKPVYADIGPKTYNLDVADVRRKITSRTKAIIIQHTFGLPGPVRELREVARANKIYLIEDLAHALGAEKEGKHLGTDGDVSLLSFGRDKVISSVFGGAVVTADKQLISRLRAKQRELRYPPRWWLIQQLFHPLLMAVIRPTYFWLGGGKYLLVAAQKMKLLSLAVSRRERQGLPPSHLSWRFSPALGFLLKRQVKKIGRFTRHRRKVAGMYRAIFSGNLPIVPEISGAAWLRWPVQVDDPKALIRAAKKQGIMLGDWYNAPVVPGQLGKENVVDYQLGSCPVAEEVSQKIVNLPTHVKILVKDVEKIRQFFKRQELIYGTKRNS